jgi:hypothetical protein
MKELLEKSAQIVLREPVNGAQGQQLGEEVVAVFPSDDRIPCSNHEHLLSQHSRL